MDGEQDRSVTPGTSVGLGRVVDNPAGLGNAEPEAAEGPLVEEASEDSFPASDPPTFMSDTVTPEVRDAAGAAGPAGTDEPAGDLPGTELPDREDPV